jgi:hypothetical protein
MKKVIPLYLEIREFHEINLQITKNHPKMILDIIRTIEFDCAPNFKMAGIE